MNQAEQNAYRDRFYEAETPEELLALLNEMSDAHPDDEFAMTLGSEIAMAIGMEKPELLEGL